MAGEWKVHGFRNAMWSLGWNASVERRFKLTIQSKHNLLLGLKQDLTAKVLNQQWVSDIIYGRVFYTRPGHIGLNHGCLMTQVQDGAHQILASRQLIRIPRLPVSVGTSQLLCKELQRGLLRQRGNGNLLPLVQDRADQGKTLQDKRKRRPMYSNTSRPIATGQRAFDTQLLVTL